MGITFGLIEQLEARGVFSDGNIRVLDIGSSNLYQAEVSKVEGFIRRFKAANSQSDLSTAAGRLAEGSMYTADGGGTNESFVGELFERCGMNYLSFDIAKGYKTEVLDLNRSSLPEKYLSTFDLVLNIGTTEHVLNQFNSFNVIHDATKIGGTMVHQLPVAGFTDHGYFVYTGRMFFDLAGFNRYELVDLWYDGPAGSDKLTTSVDSYKSYFPKLGNIYQTAEKAESLQAIQVPNCSLTIILRKTEDRPFLACLETSTSVGEVPADVRIAYANSVSKKAAIIGRTITPGPIKKFLRAVFK